MPDGKDSDDEDYILERDDDFKRHVKEDLSQDPSSTGQDHPTLTTSTSKSIKRAIRKRKRQVRTLEAWNDLLSNADDSYIKKSKSTKPFRQSVYNLTWVQQIAALNPAKDRSAINKQTGELDLDVLLLGLSNRKPYQIDIEKHASTFAELAQLAASTVDKDQWVEETITFAGKTQQIRKKVSSNIKTKTSHENKPKTNRSSGLDTLLTKIKGPRNISTVEKTSADWDQFKEKEGIKASLERYSKSNQGYVDKQAFLNRVDLRQFELEKEQRARERAKRDLEQAKIKKK